MVLLLDAMGGDYFPEVPIKAAKLALDRGLSLALIGDQEKLQPLMKAEGIRESQVEIHHCPDFIAMDDSIGALTIKKKSTIRLGYELLKAGKGQAFISAGHSGAMMALGMLILRNLPGVDRACIAAILPSKKGQILLADAGANLDCEPKHLYQFAILATTYLECVFDIANPKVALLNIGEEETKGGQVLKDAYKLFKESSLNFSGNLEGKNFFQSDNDIAISDGLAGNILLKTVQGTALYIVSVLKEEIQKSFLSKIGAAFMFPALKALRKKMNAANYAGAPLLGLRELSIVCHGSSKPDELARAMQFAQWAVDKNLQAKMLKSVESRIQKA